MLIIGIELPMNILDANSTTLKIEIYYSERREFETS